MQTDGSSFYLYVIIGSIVSWIIFYYVVKGAVKAGILAAKKHQETVADMRSGWSPERIELQKKYDRGDMPDDIYFKKLDELKATSK